jgi:chromosome partitioning protein
MTAADATQILGITLQATHKRLKKTELPFEKSQNRVYFGFDTAKALFEFTFTPPIIPFQIVKGGTGKTSLVFSLAVRASLYGARVLCIDLDQQGNLTQAFCANPESMPCMIDVIQDNLPITQAITNILPGVDLLPSRIENAVLDNTLMLKRLPLDRVYKDRIEPLRKKYDLIFIDCPPSLGQSVAAVALAADLVISPVTPEKFSISGLEVTTNELHSLEESYKCKIPIKVVINKYDNRTILSHEVLGTLMKHQKYGELLCKSYVRISQEFPNSIAKKQTIFDSLSMTTAKEDLDLLTQELLGIGNFAATQKKAV